MRGAFLSGQDWSHAARKIERMEKLTKEDVVNEIKPVFIQPDLDYQIVDSYPRANPIIPKTRSTIYLEMKSAMKLNARLSISITSISVVVCQGGISRTEGSTVTSLRQLCPLRARESCR